MKSVIFRQHATVDCINQYFIPFLILRERERSVLSSVFQKAVTVGFFFVVCLFPFFIGKDRPGVDLDQMRFAHVWSLCVCSRPFSEGWPAPSPRGTLSCPVPRPRHRRGPQWPVVAAAGCARRAGRVALAFSALPGPLRWSLQTPRPRQESGGPVAVLLARATGAIKQ